MATAMLAVVLPAAPASADTFGLCDSNHGCLPDNFNHWYCFSGTIDSNFQTAINQSMANLDTQTSYADFFDNPCGTLTDVVWQQTTAPGSTTRGDYTCLAFNNENECERARLRLNPNLLTDAANRRKTACHELGHSGGLRHGSASDPQYNDCMRSGAITSGFNTYNSHHVTHLNNRA